MALSDKFVRILNGQAPRLGEVLSDLTGTLISVPSTSATPNTNLTVAHGLKDASGNAVAPKFAHVTMGNLYIVSVDATNVTVASSAASQTGQVRIVSQPSDGYTGPRRAR